MSDREGGVLILFGALSLGGSELKMVKVGNHLAERGCPVCVAHLRPRLDARGYLSPAVPVADLRGGRGLSPSAVSRLRRKLRDLGIRSVLAVNLYPLLYASAARRLDGRERGPRMIGLVNTSTHRSRKHELAMALYAPLLRTADTVVFGSERQRNEWCVRYRLDPGRSTVIHNGVDSVLFSSPSPASREGVRAELGFSPQDVVLGTVGRVCAEKQQRNLVQAVARLGGRAPAVRGLIVGDGPDRAALEHLAWELGVAERIVFAGRRQDVRPYLGAMDIFVLTSVAVETFSNAALEAMATQRPVVLSDLGGAREMITHGSEGYIYEPGDVQALTTCLEPLVAEQRRREAMGARARERVRRCFAFESMVRRYEELIRE